MRLVYPERAIWLCSMACTAMPIGCASSPPGKKAEPLSWPKRTASSQAGPGVCLVTRGPGATNASIGVHTAFQDSTPMVLLVGDVASDCRDREAFQEVDFFRFFGPLAKRVERIDDARRIPEYMARAFATALNGRPGPVVLVLPEDMLTQPVPDSVQPLPRVEAVQAWSDPGALRTLREMLLQSERPLVLAGGGGWTPQAAQALQRFAEAWQLPVANTFRFQDTFCNRHPLYVGDVGLGINPALAQRVRQSDLLIALGPRLGESTTGSYTLHRGAAHRPKAGAHTRQRGRTEPCVLRRSGHLRGHVGGCA
jgi:acetolactate synthase I/II/III large subunit